MSKTTKVRATVRTPLFQDGKILVEPFHQRDSNVMFLRPLGGEIEMGELPDEAIVREIREETGLEIELCDNPIISFEYSNYTLNDGPRTEVMYFMNTYTTSVLKNNFTAYSTAKGKTIVAVRMTPQSICEMQEAEVASCIPLGLYNFAKLCVEHQLQDAAEFDWLMDNFAEQQKPIISKFFNMIVANRGA